MKRRLLAEASGRTRLRPDEVERALVARYSNGYLTVDRAGSRVCFQGGWWYRGEYELAPEDGGTRVTLRAYNVADRARWAVPLANRFFIGYTERTRAGLAELLRELERGDGAPD